MSKKQSSKQQLNPAGEKNSQRILYRGECPKLSNRGQGRLHYEWAYHGDPAAPRIMVRVIRNDTSGAFSNEWISLEDIQNLLERQAATPFKATIFTGLFSKKSSNNHGFLAAVLRVEGVLDSAPEAAGYLKPGDVLPLQAKLAELAASNTDLPDQVAEQQQQREAARQQRMAQMRSRMQSGQQDAAG